MVKLVHGLHQESLRMVELEVGLHQGCFIREQDVSRGGQANVGTSPQKMQESEVHDGTLSWSPKEHEASIGASL